MQNLKSFFKYLSVISLTAAVTFTASMVYFGGISKTSADEYGSRAISKLDRINSYIKNEYLYDDYDINEMDEAALKAYVSALDEPYTSYYSPDEFEAYVSAVEDSYVGIGVVISVDEEAEKIVVVAPTEDSPAREAGVKPGDYIIAVDDEPFSGEEMSECVAKIKGGKAGTKVKLTVERDSTLDDIEIERREIMANSVRSEVLDDDIGYVRITEFNTSDDKSDNDTYTEFKENIEELKSKGIKSLIIDLRDNPGGVLSVVVDVADYLLPEGIVTYTETKTGKRRDYKSDARELDMPMVVLINENSASAAEILTGALQDYDKAEIVGQTSFGKGIVQTVYPFSDGSGMSMTIAKYYTPKGVCIHGIGIEPDYEVSLPDKYADSYITDIPRTEDTQLKKAIELLKN